jgi:hypothetical protein
MTGLLVQNLKAGLRRYDRDATVAGTRLQFYMMNQFPGQTAKSWRRQFFADIGMGVNMPNLFIMTTALSGGPSLGWYRHFHAPLYISLVITHTK